MRLLQYSQCLRLMPCMCPSLPMGSSLPMRPALLLKRHAAVTPSGADDGNSSSVGSLVLHKSHYLGFGAAGALLHHLKHNNRLALAPRSVQVRTAQKCERCTAGGDVRHTAPCLAML